MKMYESLKKHPFLAICLLVALLLVGTTVANQFGKEAEPPVNDGIRKMLNMLSEPSTTDEPEEVVDAVDDETMISVKEMTAVLAAYSGEKAANGYINMLPRLVNASYVTLDEPVLSAGRTYWVSMDMPIGYLKTRTTEGSPRMSAYDNHFSCRMYYPKQVQKNQTGVIVVFVEVNNKTMVGAVSFTAAEDLSLIHGDEYPEYAGNSVVFFDDYNNVLRIRFFTGATEEFNHPDTTYNPYNPNTTEGRFFTY